MKSSIRIGLLGLGTVGAGVVRILDENGDLIERRIGVPLEIARVAVREAGKERGLSVGAGVLTTDPFEVVRDPDIDIVVELIRGKRTREAVGAGGHR